MRRPNTQTPEEIVKTIEMQHSLSGAQLDSLGVSGIKVTLSRSQKKDHLAALNSTHLLATTVAINGILARGGRGGRW